MTSTPTTPSSRPPRRRELDVLGTAIVLGLIAIHTATIFAGMQVVVNTSQSEATTMVAMLFVAFTTLWAMPTMMTIAGMTVAYSLRARTPAEFIRERVSRLVLPFVTGMVLLIPPMAYIWMLFHQPGFSQGYLPFYPRFWQVSFSLSAFPIFLQGLPPDRLFNVSHLWFLLYLFVYTLLWLPAFLALRRPGGQRLVERMGAFFSRRWAIVLMGVPVAVIESLLTTEWPAGWNRFVWPCFILYGFLFASEARFDTALVRHRKGALALGIVAFLLYFGGMGAVMQASGGDPFVLRTGGAMVVRFMKGLAGWLCTVAVLGFATHWGHRRSLPPAEVGPSGWERLAAYGREVQLPFYVVHQLPIVVIGHTVVQWQVSALVKFVVIALTSLAATLVLVEVVRRTAVTRFLFGMRLRRG